jgi:hypothetical protein
MSNREPSQRERHASYAAVLALLASLGLGCSGQTIVTLLKPLDDGGAGGGGSVEAGGGQRATAGTAAVATAGGSAGAEAGGAPPTDAGALTSLHLVHRYSFGGEGNVVADSVGHADGELMGGAVLDGAGHASLDGIDDYVNLPNGLLSSLTDVTLVSWLSWNGGDCWQRVFDFGGNDHGEDMSGMGATSLFATPVRCPGTGPATEYETVKDAWGSVDSNVPFPPLHDDPIAVVNDFTGGELRMYAAGALLGVGTPGPLNQLTDYNNWLGRSQWPQDPYLRGTYDEFRIYDSALTTEELTAIENAGPDALP